MRKVRKGLSDGDRPGGNTKQPGVHPMRTMQEELPGKGDSLVESEKSIVKNNSKEAIVNKRKISTKQEPVRFI